MIAMKSMAGKAKSKMAHAAVTSKARLAPMPRRAVWWISEELISAFVIDMMFSRDV